MHIVIFVVLFFLVSYFLKEKDKTKQIIKSLPVTNIVETNTIDKTFLIKGRLVAINKTISPLTKTNCIGYDYSAKKWRAVKRNTHKYDIDKRYTKVIDEKTFSNNFYIRDKTGKLEVEGSSLKIISFYADNIKTINGITYSETLLNNTKKEYFVVGKIVERNGKQILTQSNKVPLCCFDVNSYDLIFKTSNTYKIGCALFLLVILGVFLYFMFIYS